MLNILSRFAFSDLNADSVRIPLTTLKRLFSLEYPGEDYDKALKDQVDRGFIDPRGNISDEIPTDTTSPTMVGIQLQILKAVMASKCILDFEAIRERVIRIFMVPATPDLEFEHDFELAMELLFEKLCVDRIPGGFALLERGDQEVDLLQGKNLTAWWISRNHASVHDKLVNHIKRKFGKNFPNHAEEFVHEFYAKMIKGDSFRPWILKGRKVQIGNLQTWAVQVASYMANSNARDCSDRATYGCAQIREIKNMSKRTPKHAAFGSAVQFVLNEDGEGVGVEVIDTSGNPEEAVSFQETLNVVAHTVRSIQRHSGSRVDEVMAVEMLAKGHMPNEIARRAGVTRQAFDFRRDIIKLRLRDTGITEGYTGL